MTMRLFRRRRAAPEALVVEWRREPGMSGSAPVAIADAPARQPVRVAGQVTQMRMRPTSGLPSLAVTIVDGTGTAVAVFSGRRSIGGVTLGRHLAVEGVAVRRGALLEFTNPSYVLLAADAHH